MPRIFRSGTPRPHRIIEGPKRDSPRQRGYDSRWDRRSLAYRRKRPFCENPVHGDLVVFGAVVDHKHPVQDGGKVHCPDDGLWHLCSSCHGWKASLEDYARRTGQMERIVQWCDEPETRPAFRRGDLR